MEFTLGGFSQDTSATPCEVDLTEETTTCTGEPQPIITEPPEEDVETPSTSKPGAPQISSALPDILAPVVQKPAGETSSFPQSKSVFGAATTSATSSSIFGASSAPLEKATPAIVFSKTSSVGGPTSTFGGAVTSSFGGAVTSSGTTSFGSVNRISSIGTAASTAVGSMSTFGGSTSALSAASAPQAFSAAKPSTSAFGGSPASRPGGSAVVTGAVSTIFGGTTTFVTTAVSSTTAVGGYNPFVSKDTTKTYSAEKPVQKQSKVRRGSLVVFLITNQKNAKHCTR